MTESTLARDSGRSRPLRVLWLIDSLTVGGAESLVVPFARRCDRSRVEPVVCSVATIDGNPIENLLRYEDAAVLNLGARNLRDVRAFRRLLRIVHEYGIDVVHAHLTYASIWAALASRITGVPSVASLHVAPPARGRAGIRDRLMRFALNRWSTKVVAVSDALRTAYLAGGGVSASKTITVHNGIELDRFRRDRDAARARLARDLDIPSSAPIAVTVSVLRPGKGIEVLLEAIGIVARSVPDAVFVIVGDGPMRAEWTAAAEKLGVANHVRWAGYRSDVDAILAGCDLFVLPSLDDAFPTVLLEAMAACLPVVATNVGGIPEIVTPGETGELVAAGDAAALAAAVTALLRDGEERQAMGSRGRHVASMQFSTDAWLGRLYALYESVASGARR